MASALRSLATLVALPVLTISSAAQSLVQLRLEGGLGERGERLEVEIGGRIEGEKRSMKVSLFVGPRTSGAEFATLVARRLERAGFRLTRASDESGAAASLFLEETDFVRLRLAGGMGATVTTCEAAPALVRVAAIDEVGPAKLSVSVDTYSAHTKDHGSAYAQFDLGAGWTAPRVAAALLEAAPGVGMLSEKPGGDGWRPIKMKTGEAIVGLSVGLTGQGAWRLEAVVGGE